MATTPAQAHLVALRVVVDAEDGTTLKSIHALLLRLARKLAPKADYASAIIRESGEAEIHFAFREVTDATRFAIRLAAKPVSLYPGWNSQQFGELGDSELAGLEREHPPGRPRGRGPESGARGAEIQR